MKQKKKTFTTDSPQYEKNQKKKFIIRIVLFLFIGMLLGIVSAWGTDILKNQFTGTTKDIFSKLPSLQIFVFPVIMLIFTVCCILIISILTRKGKEQIITWDGEDDKHIKIADSYLSKALFISDIQVIVIQMLFGIITYNLVKNLEETKKNTSMILILIAIGIYLISLFFIIFQQNRLVSLVKQYSPEKQGSIYDTKFQKIWLSTCDEAELHMIYKASYRTHQLMIKVFSVSITVASIIGMFFSIGILCALIIGLLWLVQTCCYFITCIKLENQH